MFGSTSKPNGGLGIVLLYPQALEIEIAEPGLRIGVVQPRERQPLLQRLAVLAPVEGGKSAPEILGRGGDCSAKETDEHQGQTYSREAFYRDHGQLRALKIKNGFRGYHADARVNPATDVLGAISS